MDILTDFIPALTRLFLVFDPFASIPIFISLTMDLDKAERIRSANKAVILAFVLFLIFVVMGNKLIALLGISVASFMIAGGLILLLFALEVIFGLNIVRLGKQSVAWVIIATPILAGPGVITTAIILTIKYGYITTLISGATALLITWLFLRNSIELTHIIGGNIIEITSRVFGLLLMALAIEFIMQGGMEYVKG